MDSIVCNVSDLSQPDRSVFERLMGHPLATNQQVCIMTLDSSAPLAEGRSDAWNELRDILSEAQRNTGNAKLSPQGLDAVIDAECHDVRYGA